MQKLFENCATIRSVMQHSSLTGVFHLSSNLEVIANDDENAFTPVKLSVVIVNNWSLCIKQKEPCEERLLSFLQE